MAVDEQGEYSVIITLEIHSVVQEGQELKATLPPDAEIVPVALQVAGAALPSSPGR